MNNLYQPNKIGQWGIIKGGDIEYFAYPAVNASRLKLLLKSWAHFKANPSKPPTKAMKLGTALHMAVLEPERFANTYTEFVKPLPGSNMNKKENKEAWRKFIDSGVIPTPQKDIDFINNVSSYIQNNPFLFKLMNKDTQKEVAIWWVHESGIVCKCKIDLLRITKSGNVIIADLKKTQDASPKGFLKDCRNYNYPIQASFYSMIARKVYSDKRHFPFVFVCCEEPTSMVQHHTIDSYDIESITMWIEAKLRELSDMINNDKPFHGYSDHGNDKTNYGLINNELSPYYINQFQI